MDRSGFLFKYVLEFLRTVIARDRAWGMQGLVLDLHDLLGAKGFWLLGEKACDLEPAARELGG